MEDAAGRTAASTPQTAADQDALKELEFHWGEAYLIGCDDEGGWFAGRRDHIGAYLTASDPYELHAAIQVNYRANPVPRDLTAGDGTS